MNRINTLFKHHQGSILSVYFTAGFPESDSTLDVIAELSRQGIDMIEIGIPFSDPMADGPLIQQSSQQALNKGMSLKLLFKQLEKVREIADIPLILMGYINPVLQFGFEAFCRQAKACGIDGFIIPDLPLAEYLKEFEPLAKKYELENILLISPETPEDRIRLIDSHSNGFIYMVSSASTTGPQTAFDEAKEQYFKRIQAMKLKNPCLIGFGISNKATFDSACRHAAGAIVGSAFIRCQQASSNTKEAVGQLLEILKSKQK